jgi:hypothetical protein
MRTITGSSAVRAALETPVPAVAAGSAGVAWLRSHVARFSTGAAHTRRRALAVAELDRIPADALGRRAAAQGGHPVAVLAAALGVRVDPADVAAVAAVYHPHTAATPEADAAVDRLVVACGGSFDERSAARIGLLVQACDATEALVRTARERSTSIAEVLTDEPPVRFTRRGGELVDLASAGLPFGVGPHACPGREHAVALADGLLRYLRTGLSR